MPGTTSTALPSFSHDQHHKTDAAKRKGGCFWQIVVKKARWFNRRGCPVMQPEKQWLSCSLGFNDTTVTFYCHYGDDGNDGSGTWWLNLQSMCINDFMTWSYGQRVTEPSYCALCTIFPADKLYG